jgi:hypothetical protein
MVSGCTGLSLGENTPGSDVSLEGGAIAVDDRTETSFVLRKANEAASADPSTTPPPPASALYAVRSDAKTVSEVKDLTGRSDLRILFPDPGILLMSEEDGKDRLELFDNQSFAPLQSVDLDIRYHGTRMSPSRKFIGVADNTSEKAPIHIIDAATLERRVIPHDGEWLEAMWMHESDRLVAVVFYEMDTEGAHARILSWSVESLIAAQWKPDEVTKLWPSPELDINVPGVTGDFFFSFTWVGISPDDRWAVFPVRRVEGQDMYSYELIVLDTMTKEVRSVPGAKGPVGFTPDGATIVSYKDVPVEEGTDQSLLLIDAATLAVDPVDVPIDGGITYFISHEGNYVVVASNFGGQELVLYDVDQDKTTQMAGPGVGLNEFVSRAGKGEMWLVDNQTLFRVDVVKGEIETIETDFRPEHVNILPKLDRLVLDGAESEELYFWSPETRETVLKATLPTPE